MLFYDLPVQTAEQRREVQKFRKEMRRRGFLQLQESVYVKLLRNTSSSENEIAAVRKLAPQDGLVQALPMSLQVFGGMRALIGSGFDMKLFSDDLLFL